MVDGGLCVPKDDEIMKSSCGGDDNGEDESGMATCIAVRTGCGVQTMTSSLDWIEHEEGNSIDVSALLGSGD